MKDTLTSLNHRDFNQRYSGTYGHLLQPGKSPLLVQMTNADSSQANFIDETKSNYLCRVDSGIIFEFLPLNRRVVPTPEDGVLFITRKPARMWKRGVCPDNTYISELKSGKQQKIDFKILTVAYGNANYKESVSMFNRSMRTTCCLDDKFSLVSGKVYIYNHEIGKYNNGEITINDSLFKQELMDTIARNGYSFKVNHV